TPGEDIDHGEVLTFRDFAAALRIVDRLEDHPNLYVRRPVPVSYPDGREDRALAYFIRPGREPHGRRVRSGDWLDEVGARIRQSRGERRKRAASATITARQEVAMALIENSKTKLTYEEYVLLPDDGNIHEIIDGDHFINPAPGTYHQTISRRLQYQLYEQVELREKGLVFNAPTDVELSRTDIVQPDLLVVLAERTRMISPAKVIGPPDLVVEILSETTRTKDEKLKLLLYQRTGVPEYWIVDPKSQLVRKYRLRGEAYEIVTESHDEVEFDGLPGVTVDLRQVW
ncbi:MAG: Uma2 family endonuclease, partial [Planctomycetota bacterium]|nr:Uma2 family endonuclease [Planctomycetota bacterium]